MEQFFKNALQKLNFENLFFRSVRKGFTLTIPFLLIGSFALIFLSLPFSGYQALLKASHLSHFFRLIYDATFGFMSVMVVLGISYAYATESQAYSKTMMNPFIVSIVALISFFAISGVGKNTFSLTHLGTSGIFTALVTASLSSHIYIRLFSIKHLRLKSFTDGIDSTFGESIAAIFPATITITLFAGFGQYLSSLGHLDLQTLISAKMTTIFSNLGNTLPSGLLFIFLIHFFWFFGLHGNNMLETVAQNVFVPALYANQSLLAQGLPAQNVLTKTFFDTFVIMGGAGATLCLLCAILIFGQQKNLKRHGRLSALPALFNINELMIFGIPIVMNPVFLVPFIGLPLLLTLTSYAAIKSGFVPYTAHTVEWTTPIFLSGYTATHSITGSFLQLFNLVLGTLCYAPFIKFSEKRTEIRSKRNIGELIDTFIEHEQRGEIMPLLSRRDALGNIARLLAAELESDLLQNNLAFHYQPQVDENGQVFGIEALIRWHHKSYGYIYPPLIIALIEEGESLGPFDTWLAETISSDWQTLNQNGYRNLTLSVNASARQLEDTMLVTAITSALEKQKIPFNQLIIEITEQVALSGSKKVHSTLNTISQIGIGLAMDDFGMGHSSLMYLKDHTFNSVKLDKVLVQDILTSDTTADIVASIVYLSQSQHFSITAEYVENEMQRDKLRALGCLHFQGYLYSKALPIEELCHYLQENWTCISPR